MSQKLFKNVGLETIKGGAITALKNAGNAGAFDFTTMTLSGATIAAETFELGSDVYEINLVATDSTFEATAAVTAGDTAFTLTGTPSVVPLPGDVVRMETEMMIVIDYNVNGPSMNVVRGAFGTTDATHTAGANTSLFQALAPVVAGNLVVPTTALAAVTAKVAIAGAVNFWAAGYRKGLGGGTGITVKNGLPVVAVVGVTADSVLFGYEADGGVSSTLATDMTNATLSTFAGGVEPAELVYTKHIIVAAGTGALTFFAPWDVAEAWVTIYGADGALIEAAANTVTVTNSRQVVVSAAGSLAAGVVAVVEMLSA
jgi:hypothetical protein